LLVKTFPNWIFFLLRRTPSPLKKNPGSAPESSDQLYGNVISVKLKRKMPINVPHQVSDLDLEDVKDVQIEVLSTE
jgi:hypothetical protein